MYDATVLSWIFLRTYISKEHGPIFGWLPYLVWVVFFYEIRKDYAHKIIGFCFIIDVIMYKAYRVKSKKVVPDI